MYPSTILVGMPVHNLRPWPWSVQAPFLWRIATFALFYNGFYKIKLKIDQAITSRMTFCMFQPPCFNEFMFELH